MTVQIKYGIKMRSITTVRKSAILEVLRDGPRPAPVLRSLASKVLGKEIPIETFYDVVSTLEECGMMTQGKLRYQSAAEAIEEFRKILGKPISAKVARKNAKEREAMMCRITVFGTEIVLLDKIEKIIPRASKHYVTDLRKVVYALHEKITAL